MAVKVNIVRPEVLNCRKEFRVACPAVFAPCLGPEREDGYPFLRNYLFQIGLLVPCSVPRNLALAHSPCI